MLNHFEKVLLEEVDETTILSLIAQHLSVPYDGLETTNYCHWVWGSVVHKIFITRKSNDVLRCNYVSTLFSGLEGDTAHVMANELNKRLLGVCFVATPGDNDWSLNAFAAVTLDSKLWQIFALFVFSLKRTTSIVEALSRNEDFMLDFRAVHPGLLDVDYASAPTNFIFSRDVDPYSTVFATGLWIADNEAENFHQIIKKLLDVPGRSSPDHYSAVFEIEEVAIASDMKLESTYSFGVGLGEEGPFNGYDIKVDVKNVRHPELGSGLQTVLTLPYFASAEKNQDEDFLALELANQFNHNVMLACHGDVRYLAPSLVTGSLVAIHDQLFYGRFIQATVLEELLELTNQNFSYSLGVGNNPDDCRLVGETFAQLLLTHQLESAREPDSHFDYWSGCDDYRYVPPILAPKGQEYGVHPVTPLMKQIACWGFFNPSGSPLASLEFVKDCFKMEISLVYRVRDVLKPNVMVLATDDLDSRQINFDEVIETFFFKLNWPQIDWLLIQDPDYDEVIRRSLRSFARTLSSKRDVGKLISDIHLTDSLWNYISNDVPGQNNFNQEHSIEAGFEWIVTRPDIVDRALAYVPTFTELSTLIRDNASQDEIKIFQILTECVFSVRNGVIPPISNRDNLREFIEDNFEIEETVLGELMTQIETKWLDFPH